MAAAENHDLAQRVEKLEADRQAMQLAGTHPAPCARHCEANAFQIEIRGLKASLKSADSRLHEVAVICATAEQERDSLAAELKALREQEPVATVETSGDKGGCIAWVGVRIDVGVKLYARPHVSPRISATHREEADEAIENALGEALDCVSAWREGEMKRRDFMPVACCDDRVASIRDAAFSVFDLHLPKDRLGDRFIRDCAFKHGILQAGADINPEVMEFAREIEATSLSINGIESALLGGELQPSEANPPIFPKAGHEND